jgi:hypothetical protein
MMSVEGTYNIAGRGVVAVVPLNKEKPKLVIKFNFTDMVLKLRVKSLVFKHSIKLWIMERQEIMLVY